MSHEHVTRACYPNLITNAAKRLRWPEVEVGKSKDDPNLAAIMNGNNTGKEHGSYQRRSPHEDMAVLGPAVSDKSSLSAGVSGSNATTEVNCCWQQVQHLPSKSPCRRLYCKQRDQTPIGQLLPRLHGWCRT
jgi:hypothetical protein